jgi:hypothetical protein
MFKGAYTDTFYRAIRDALHAEVDSWKIGADGQQLRELGRLWKRVGLLEPISRNADATKLTDAVDAPVVCDASHQPQLIAVHGLVNSGGEA